MRVWGSFWLFHSIFPSNSETENGEKCTRDGGICVLYRCTWRWSGAPFIYQDRYNTWKTVLAFSQRWLSWQLCVYCVCICSKTGMPHTKRRQLTLRQDEGDRVAELLALAIEYSIGYQQNQHEHGVRCECFYVLQKKTNRTPWIRINTMRTASCDLWATNSSEHSKNCCRWDQGWSRIPACQWVGDLLLGHAAHNFLCCFLSEHHRRRWCVLHRTKRPCCYMLFFSFPCSFCCHLLVVVVALLLLLLLLMLLLPPSSLLLLLLSHWWLRLPMLLNQRRANDAVKGGSRWWPMVLCIHRFAHNSHKTLAWESKVKVKWGICLRNAGIENMFFKWG